ncbi:serine/threonine protein kinase Ran1 [Datura stramonium]|uniref:Serine/threonine protein kinase Ran1 n=1 Tax=Datura stramonium TaxID=4076 RepID=A0ABS8S1Z9_DATST|nr:serine/threonine protein kinase Ran1 [Datura stramonium]
MNPSNAIDATSREYIRLELRGMTCAACSTSVEGALMGINGVVKASVALLQNKAGRCLRILAWSRSGDAGLLVCLPSKELHVPNL